jgi:hypothetical protein
MKKLVKLFFVVIICSLTSCESDLGITPVQPSKNDAVVEEKSYQSVLFEELPVSSSLIKEKLQADNWYTAVVSPNDPNHSWQEVGLMFTNDGKVYWADVDGTFLGSYRTLDGGVELKVRKGSDQIMLKFRVYYKSSSPMDDHDAWFIYCLEKSGTIEFQAVHPLRTNTFNNAAMGDGQFSANNQVWKPFLSYPSIPGLFDERYSFKGNVSIVSSNGVTLKTGSYQDDSIVKHFGRTLYNDGTKQAILKWVDGNGNIKRLYTSEFLTDGSVIEKYFLLL